MKQSCAIACALLMAAHCLRAGLNTLAAFCLVTPLLMMIRARWGTRLLQGFLVLAGIEWIRTLTMIAAQRSAEHRPWLRMAAILGSVAALSFLSAWLVRPRNSSPTPAPENT